MQGEYLYSSSTGSKFNAENFRKRVYYKALADVGYSEEDLKKRNPHVCRHTFASMCAKKGVDPKALQDIIGHAQIETTLNTYTHTDVQWLKSAVKDL
jgi:site-specific recombinase XerD